MRKTTNRTQTDYATACVETLAVKKASSVKITRIKRISTDKKNNDYTNDNNFLINIIELEY